MKVRDIPTEKIFTTGNVRQEDGELGDLMASLGKRQLQPAGVIPRGERYELIWGHRRLKAAKLNNEQTLACHILEGVSDAEIPLIKLEENVQRKQLTTQEIVEAADAIKAKHPGMGDHQIDRMLGKQPGYLSNCRSTLNCYKYLKQKGLTKKALATLSDEELRSMRAELEAKGEKRRRSFHRGEKTPATGFRIVNSPGPNVVVICAGPDEKLRVLKDLRALAKKFS